jgi:hypothetical protein
VGASTGASACRDDVRASAALTVLPRAQAGSPLALCLLTLACVFYADSVMQSHSGPGNSYTYADLEYAGSAAAAARVLDAFDQLGALACGWSVGLHMANVVFYTLVLVLLDAWAWRSWLSAALTGPASASPRHATVSAVPRPPQRAAGAPLPEGRLADVFLAWGHGALLLQLAASVPYLIAHIGILALALTAPRPEVSEWPALITAFDVLFLLALANSLLYVLSSAVLLRLWLPLRRGVVSGGARGATSAPDVDSSDLPPSASV